MDAVQVVTLTIACIGCGLGVLNTWKTFDKERTRLAVRPLNVIPYGGAAVMYPGVEFSIEVVNRSAFPVTVTGVGFLHRGVTSRMAVLQPVTLDGKGAFPRRLEAREAVSFYMGRPTPLDGRPLTYAYATTSDGHTFKGTTPALQGMNARREPSIS